MLKIERFQECLLKCSAKAVAQLTEQLRLGEQKSIVAILQSVANLSEIRRYLTSSVYSQLLKVVQKVDAFVTSST